MRFGSVIAAALAGAAAFAWQTAHAQDPATRSSKSGVYTIDQLDLIRIEP